MDRVRILLPFLLLATAGAGFAGTVSVSGNFDALGLSIQWDPYLYALTLPVASDVTVRSTGYAAGGFVPILSVFDGSGPGAAFRALDDGNGGFDDPLLQLVSVPAGLYTVAITAYANYPWAYLDPTCCSTLGDGFIGLGFLDNTTDLFTVEITTRAVGAVPEPATALLLGTAVVVAAGAKRRLLFRSGERR